MEVDPVIRLTKNLPDEFDELDLKTAMKDYSEFREFATKNIELVKAAYRMVHLIKAQGRHAGGLIISNVPIKDYIPLTLCKDNWTSAWTEGRSPQLSKFGFVKFDFLGLKNLLYIRTCLDLIKKNKGHTIDWSDIDPENHKAGTLTDENGKVTDISLEDDDALDLASDLRTETVFQFETDLAKSILAKGGVKSFNDLVIYTSLGRPGPLPMIDTYIKRRDGKDDWRKYENPEIAEMLGDTHGVICFDSETMIRTSNGQDVPIKKLAEDDLVYSYNKSTKTIEIKPVKRVGKTREGKGLKITTDDNRSITVTHDHKFICWDRDKRANELTIGDLIPVPTSIEWKFANERIDTIELPGTQENWGYFIGYLIGDGLLSGTGVSLSCGNKESHADKLKDLIEQEFGLVVHKYWATRSWYLQISDRTPAHDEYDVHLDPFVDSSEWWIESYKKASGTLTAKKLEKSTWYVYDKLRQHVYIDGQRKSNYTGPRNRLKLILRRMGLECNVYNKRIPSEIFNSNMEVLAACIAGLIDSDGCINKTDRGFNSISITSCNKTLLSDISKALDILHLDHNFQQDRVFIWNHHRFRDIVLPHIKFKGIKFSHTSIVDGSSLGWVPKEELLKYASKNNKSYRQLDRDGIISRSAIRHSSAYCRSTVGRKIGIVPNNIRYQKIKKIEEVDGREYYGLSVADNHTVIADNIIIRQCFQEQLAAMWRKFAKFTAPEAEAARKAVAKKWVEKLAPIEAKWVSGASKTLGEDVAKAWWEKMQTFGRYAFNKSHSTAYVVISHRCLWLKAHYPTEWWAAVMSDCDTKRLHRYMGCARSEGVEFGQLNCDNLTMKFSVDGKLVTPGLTSVKGIGVNQAEKLVNDNTYNDLDDFITKNGKNKIVCERMIKLGAFDKKHNNRKAIWTWYQYKYGVDEDSRMLRKYIKCAFAWPFPAIEAERKRQEREYFKQYPARKVVPKKITNWLPKTPFKKDKYVMCEVADEDVLAFAKSISPTKEQIMALVDEDFSLPEILAFEKAYLGYYCHSPLDMFKNDGSYTIAEAREGGILEAVIEKMTIRRKQTTFVELIVTDGIENAKVMVWQDDLANNGNEVFQEGTGVKMRVTWKDQFKSFNLKSGSIIIPLERKHAS